MKIRLEIDAVPRSFLGAVVSAPGTTRAPTVAPMLPIGLESMVTLEFHNFTALETFAAAARDARLAAGDRNESRRETS